MSKAEELITMLKEEVIPEVEEYMDDLFELIASKKATKEDMEEVEGIQELRDDFRQMLEDVESGEVDEEECAELIEELNAMRAE